MEWPQLATHLCSAGMACLGGLWFYLHKFRGRRRKVSDALTQMLCAALLGAAGSLILCRWLCKDQESAQVVVGICGLSGLLGLTPVVFARWIRIIAGQLPDEQVSDGVQRIPDPPSD